MSNDYNRLRYLSSALKKDGFMKAMPIFALGEMYFENEDIVIEYPDKDVKEEYQELHLKYRKRNSPLLGHLLKTKSWYVLDDTVIESLPSTLSTTAYTLKLHRIDDTPFYIRDFAKYLGKKYKDDFIFITDSLPFHFKLRIHTEKSSNQHMLSMLATRLDIPYNNKDFKKMIADKNKSIKESIDDLFQIRMSLYVDPNSKDNTYKKGSFEDEKDKVNIDITYSYCLLCGNKITKSDTDYFCNTKDKGYKSEHVCRDGFYYRLRKAGKGKTQKESGKAYNKELQHIMLYAPKKAYDIFVLNNHPELFLNKDIRELSLKKGKD